MTGFNDLPNEIVLELWHHVVPPDDIVSFARVSKRIFASATPFLKEYRRLKSEYSALDNNRSYDGSMLANLLKDVLLNPHIAFYVTELRVRDGRDPWEDPKFDPPFRLDLDLEEVENYVWHVPYPEQDMELFRNGIRLAEYVLPSEVDVWIQLLERGHEDPILALLLSLLPNLRTLSLEDHPGESHLCTTLRRIAEGAATKSFAKLKSISLSDFFSGQHDDMSLIKPLLLLPSVEKISCYNLPRRYRQSGIPKYFIPPQSSNITELVFDSCSDIAEHISVLLEGIKGLKKFTYVPVGETVEAFRLQSTLLNRCRHSLEYLKMVGFEYGQSNYRGTLGGLRLFENLKTIDVEHSILVDPDADGDYDVADLLPTSIEAIDLSSQNCGMVSHIRPFIRSVVGAKRTQLPNLKSSNYHVLDFVDWVEEIRVPFTDMRPLCERNEISLRLNHE